jgi:hypothetical protein
MATHAPDRGDAAAGSRGVPREAYARPAPRPPVLGSLKRAFSMFRSHGMTDWGASMTYYLVMSLFPALLVIVSLLGLFGQQGLVTSSIRYLRDAGAPPSVVQAVGASLDSLVASSGAKVGAGLLIGIVLGINGASGAFGAAVPPSRRRAHGARSSAAGGAVADPDGSAADGGGDGGGGPPRPASWARSISPLSSPPSRNASDVM